MPSGSMWPTMTSNRRLIEDVEANFGPIALFCANAGIGREGDEQSPDEEWDLMWGINFKSHVFAARYLIPLWTNGVAAICSSRLRRPGC